MNSGSNAPKSGLNNVNVRAVCVAALVMACAFLIMHAIFGNNGFIALRRQQREYRALQKRVQELRRENEDLELQNAKLQSDPKAIERLAREQLRLARPGEIIYTLPEQHAPAAGDHQPDSK